MTKLDMLQLEGLAGRLQPAPSPPGRGSPFAQLPPVQIERLSLARSGAAAAAEGVGFGHIAASRHHSTTLHQIHYAIRHLCF
jgi:hypothetical protein